MHFTTHQRKGEATILVFHGNADAAIRQTKKGRALAEEGFGVLLVEYRGYPGSTGTPSETGLYADGRAAYDFVFRQREQLIGLYAHSLGTGVAVKLATERDVFFGCFGITFRFFDGSRTTPISLDAC